MHDIAQQLDGSDSEQERELFSGLDDSYNDEEWRPNTRRNSSSSEDMFMDVNSNSDCSLPPPQGESGDTGQEVRVFMDPPLETSGNATDVDTGK